MAKAERVTSLNKYVKSLNKYVTSRTILDAALVANWQFTEESGLTAVDSSDNGHDGVRSQDASTSLAIGPGGHNLTAITLNSTGATGLLGLDIDDIIDMDVSDILDLEIDIGSADEIIVPDFLYTDTDNTVSFWIKAPIQSGNAILGHYDTGSESWYVETNGSSLSVLIYTEDGLVKNYQCSVPILDNKWHLFTYTFLTNEVRLFVDGYEDTDVNVITDLFINRLRDVDVDFVIGARYTSGSIGNRFVGKLSDIRIYNRVLSIEDINLVYDLSKPYFIINPVLTGSGEINDILTLSFEASDGDIDIEWFRIGGWGTLIATDVYNYTPTEYGRYICRVTVTNDIGSTSALSNIIKITNIAALRNVVSNRGNVSSGFNSELISIEGSSGKLVEIYEYPPDATTFRDYYYYNSKLNQLFKKKKVINNRKQKLNRWIRISN